VHRQPTARLRTAVRHLFVSAGAHPGPESDLPAVVVTSPHSVAWRVLGNGTAAHIAGTMLVGVLVVIFAFGPAQADLGAGETATRNSIGIALAVILIASSPWITARKANVARVDSVDGEWGCFLVR